jgi:hypothetical protein
VAKEYGMTEFEFKFKTGQRKDGPLARNRRTVVLGMGIGIGVTAALSQLPVREWIRLAFDLCK